MTTSTRRTPTLSLTDLPASVDSVAERFGSDKLSIRSIAELTADKQRLAERVYFDGGDLLAAEAGRFRFTFGDGESAEIGPSEFLVVYPGSVVTIDSVAKGGHLCYVILNGSHVASFFDSFGFYDRLRFKTDLRYGNFCELKRQAELSLAGTDLMARLTDVFTTLATDLRQGGNALFFRAVRLIHRNLDDGIVRLDPLCDELNVSRSHLHQLFVRNGLKSPGAFIRREQLRRAVNLLKNSQLSVAEIAQQVGVPSAIYFTAFIRRMTGKTPSEVRRGR